MSNVLLNAILLIFVILFVTLGYRSRDLNDGLYTMIFSIGSIIIISEHHHHGINDMLILTIIVVNGLTYMLFNKAISHQARM